MTDLDATALRAAYDAQLRTIDPDDGTFAPREPCPDLDLPAWRYLRDRQREWLLPGVGTGDRTGHPYAVCVDSHDKVWLTDFTTNTLLRSK